MSKKQTLAVIDDDETKENAEKIAQLENELKEMEVSERDQTDAVAPAKKTRPYVSGMFHNFDFPDRVFEFWFNNIWVSLKPEEEIEIPLEIYNHLQECSNVPLRKFVRERPDEAEGVSGQLKITSRKKSYDFVRYRSFDKEV